MLIMMNQTETQEAVIASNIYDMLRRAATAYSARLIGSPAGRWANICASACTFANNQTLILLAVSCVKVICSFLGRLHHLLKWFILSLSNAFVAISGGIDVCAKLIVMSMFRS